MRLTDAQRRMPTITAEPITATPPEGRLANEETTGKETGLPPRTLRDLRSRGLIPFFKIGRLVRYDPRLVRAALEINCLIHANQKRARKGSK